MKVKHIFSFFFSLVIFFSTAQKKEHSLRKSWIYEPNFLVGFDVLNAGASVLSDRKLFQAFVSSKVKGPWYAVADLGYEDNIYIKNGYDVTAAGPFARVGTTYMLVHDQENHLNGFFAGGKLAASYYTQEYRAIPIRGFGGSEEAQAFPSSRQSSYWAEINVGGRVQLFDLPFFLEATVQPKYLIFSTRQDEIVPMIVPGFGKSSSKFNVGFSWNVAYSF